MAKKQTMNIGYSVSEGHPYGTFMFTFADRMEKFSANLESGAVKVKVHCCHKMGSEQEQFKKLQLVHDFLATTPDSSQTTVCLKERASYGGFGAVTAPKRAF